MKRISVLLLLLASAGFAGTVESIALPKPNIQGGKPLMQVLSERQSTRTFTEEKLSPQLLSNMLWAAFGISRPDGRRTAPSASNWQEVQIYVVMAEASYLYDPKANRLELVVTGDLRAATGTQDFPAKAALNLVYVSDTTKTAKAAEPNRSLYSGADVGFIAENVYLFCASEGLGTVVRGSVKKDELAQALKLTPDQKIVLAQTVGYPKK